MAKGGTGALSVDGKDVASKSIAHTTPVLLTIDETFDIGSDTRTPVDDADYQVPFPFTGTISKVDIKLGPPQMLPEDSKAAQEHAEQHEQVRDKSQTQVIYFPVGNRNVHCARSCQLAPVSSGVITL